MNCERRNSTRRASIARCWQETCHGLSVHTTSCYQNQKNSFITFGMKSLYNRDNDEDNDEDNDQDNDEDNDTAY